MEKNEVENTPLEKRNKEEQIRSALRLERYARLDKMKNLRSGHTLRLKDKHEKNMILTKQDGLKRATSQCLQNKSKNGME